MALPEFLEIVKVHEYQSKQYHSHGSYKTPAVAVTVRNTDNIAHYISIQLQKKKKNDVIVDTDFIYLEIPPKSTMEGNKVFHGIHMDEKPGVWRIVGCKCDQKFYSIDEILLNTSKSPCFVATSVYQDPNHPVVENLRLFRYQILEKTCLGFCRK